MSQAEQIARYVIYPTLGISRVGNSDEYFYASEIPGCAADPRIPCSGEPRYKDAQGRIKRQAARFRVYGLDADGQVVTEITPEVGTVAWSVHLANRKASWYEFVNPMDLNERAIDLKNRLAIAVTQRNTPIYGPGPTREALTIDAGDARISGVGQVGSDLDAGTFLSENVYLGQLRTDDKGRLVVLGGRGLAATLPPFNPLSQFANNDGWYDDISDGPIRATVCLHGSNETFAAEPAMVAVVPPNYGPGLFAPTTLYDIVLDVYYHKPNGPKPPLRPSFQEHIWPIFKAMTSTEWVNQGFYVLFGAGAPYQFNREDVYRRLASRSEADRSYRMRLFKWFSNPAETTFHPAEVPPIYGDALRDFSTQPNSNLSVTRTQYKWLQQWAEGDFEDDANACPPPVYGLPASPVGDALDQLPLNDRPFSLDRAALEEILGGPFRPGVELSWIFRVDQMWKDPHDNKSSPFRLNIVENDDEVRDDYGPVLSPEVALSKEGPVHKSGPGTLTRWMGVPWQADAASCLGGYDPSTFLPLPSLWPARAPTQVLSQDAYDRSLDTKLRPAQRLKHLSYRQFWLRDLDNTETIRRLNDMATEWFRAGIVTTQEAPSGLEEFGYFDRVWVETERDPKFSKFDPTFEQVLIAEFVVEPPRVRDQEAAHQQTYDKVLGDRNAKQEPNAPTRRKYGRIDL